MSISQNIKTLKAEIKPARLLLVTKNRSAEEIRKAIKAGVKYIGENKLQEIQSKYDQQLFHELNQNNVELHFIGHLQGKKIKQVVQLCDVIHSVDSLELVEKIDLAAQRLEKIMPIFLQLNLTDEEQKHGIKVNAIAEIVDKVRKFPNLKLQGLMSMGKLNDEEATRAAFKKCKELADKFNLHEISMGMSSDYQIAIEEGSTMVRIGGLIFD